MIGLVGYPNVGKSSTINSLIGEKKVSVSATPGKTKHFQTIHLSENIVLCDCPGLVFPQFATTRADLVINRRFLLFPEPDPDSPSVPSTSFTYASRSSHLNRRGFRASTICTIRCERSKTRQSCRQTSRLRSKGVSKRPSSSASLRTVIKGLVDRSRDENDRYLLSKTPSPI